MQCTNKDQSTTAPHSGRRQLGADWLLGARTGGHATLTGGVARVYGMARMPSSFAGARPVQLARVRASTALPLESVVRFRMRQTKPAKAGRQKIIKSRARLRCRDCASFPHAKRASRTLELAAGVIPVIIWGHGSRTRHELSTYANATVHVPCRSSVVTPSTLSERCNASASS